MINKKIIIVILILFNIIFVVSSFSQMQEKVDLKLYKQFDYKEKVDVTIYLKDKNTNFDLQKKDLEIEYKSETRNVVSATITKRALNELLSNKNVLRVKSRPKLRTFLQDSVPLVNASSVWPIQILGSNITGKNEVICIIDSGINYSHVALGGCSRSTFLAGNCSKVIGGYAFYNNVTQDKNDVIGDSDHGTHVAGIAVANGSIIGVAPEAKIVALKACGPTSACDYNAIVDSISWCVNNAFIYNITVISMSLGSIPPDLYTNYCDNEDANVTSLINNATSMNISVVAATGNNGNTTAIAWPACIKNVTAVSGTDKSDSMYSDGNRNNITDLLAPGVSINSTVLNGGYGPLSGTSMATPHVAGAFALIRQFFRLQNNRVPTPDEIRNVLNNTGKRIDDSAGSGYNFSRIDIYSALISIDSSNPTVILNSPNNATVQFNQNVTFRCSVNDVLLSNITLYVWNSSGVYNHTEVRQVSGTNTNQEFNLTLGYGSYKWNCLAYDSKGNFSFANSNYSLTIGQIAVTLNSPTNNLFTNQNQTYNCSAETDPTKSLRNITLNIWNSSVLVYNLTVNISGISNSTSFQYNFTQEMNYSWNCLAYNNASESAWANNYTITYDITEPEISLISPINGTSSATTSYNFTFNVSDTNNISNCTLILNGSIINSLDSVSKTSTNGMYNSSLVVGSHSWSINCTDIAGNVGNSSSWGLTITSLPQQQIISSGGGGGAVITAKEYTPTTEQISQGYTQELKKNDKIKFTFFDEKIENHTLTITDIGKDYAVLTIQSNITNLKLGLGQSAKLNLTSGDYYNFYIKLNSIQDNKADITIQTIHEEIPKPKITGQVTEEKEEEEKKETEKTEEEIEAEKRAAREKIVEKIKNVLIIILVIGVLVLLAERITRERREKLKKRKK